MRWLQSLMTKPSAKVLAQRELEDAERELLAWQTTAEHADAMVVCHEARIERLKAMLHQEPSS